MKVVKYLNLLLCVGALLVSSGARADILDDARALIASHQAAQAYALLSPLQDARSGEPAYDYLLGLAALDSGRAGEAVFALERVLAVDPQHKQARAEIARAYYQLREIETAKAEFETLKQQGVPAGVRETMNRYLAAIDQELGAAEGGTRIRGYLAATLGYDTNVNSAGSDQLIAIPAFPGVLFTLNDSLVEEGAPFTRVSGAFSLVHDLGEGYSFLLGGSGYDLETRSPFDTASLSTYFGISRRVEQDNFTITAQGEDFRVDGSDYRYAFGIAGQWRRQLDNLSSASLYVQATRLEYPGQSVRDATRYVAGAGYTRALTGKTEPVIYAGIYGGSEDESRAGVPWLGHDLVGLRLGGQLKLRPLLDGYASVEAEYRNYGGTDPTFLKSRDDRRYRAVLGLDYHVAENWKVSPEISYTRNASNIVINDYDRTVVSLTLRRDFN